MKQERVVEWQIGGGTNKATVGQAEWDGDKWNRSIKGAAVAPKTKFPSQTQSCGVGNQMFS